ncbi:MAG: hypothetical protein ABI972_11225 [Acidobacteriota bacterium]
MKLTTLMLAVCLAVPAFAQEAAKFYKLDFVVKELDDNKVVSAKSYTTFATSDQKERYVCSVRTGNRVPYQAALNSWQYADVGVNIDCAGAARDWNGQIMLSVVAEISTLPSGAEATPNALPTVRQNKWNSTVVLPIGKATTLFSSDDLNSKRKMQLELTATLIK